MESMRRNPVLAVVATALLLSACGLSGGTKVPKDQTRLRNEQELCELRAAGYRPDIDYINYPADLMQAQARVNAGLVSPNACPKQ